MLTFAIDHISLPVVKIISSIKVRSIFSGHPFQLSYSSRRGTHCQGKKRQIKVWHTLTGMPAAPEKETRVKEHEKPLAGWGDYYLSAGTIIIRSGFGLK